MPQENFEYELLKRDESGERMNPCTFHDASDEKARKTAASHLGIPELSEKYFGKVGYFKLSRKGGPVLFP